MPLLNTIHVLHFWGSKPTPFFTTMDMIHTLGRSLMPNRVMTNDDLGVLHRKDVVREPLHIRGLGTESITTPAIAV